MHLHRYELLPHIRAKLCDMQSKSPVTINLVKYIIKPQLSSYPTISTSTFYHNPSRGGIILRNLIILNRVWVPAVKLSLLSSTAVTYSSKREVIVYTW